MPKTTFEVGKHTAIMRRVLRKRMLELLDTRRCKIRKVTHEVRVDPVKMHVLTIEYDNV